MNDYIIYSDSACDIPAELMQEWGIATSSLSFHFEGEQTEYFNGDMNLSTFYDRMREGAVAKTSAVNAQTFAEAFEPILKEGKDILYIGFSSGLSATYHAATVAAAQLAEEYPERVIKTVDSKSGSVGQFLLIYLTVQKKKAGASIDEAADYAAGLVDSLSLWVTVEDLVYLKRGGRISSASAAVGGILGIKPIIHVNEEGKLVSVSKVRGRKNSLKALADKYGEFVTDREHGVPFITHVDCPDDAAELAKLVYEQYQVKVEFIAPMGPVIGAHLGPGGLAFCFIGTK